MRPSGREPARTAKNPDYSVLENCFQIGEQVDPVFFFLQAREGHLGFRDIFLRLGEISVERFIVPDEAFLALLLHRLGIFKLFNSSGLAPIDVDQVRPDLVLFLLDGVAGLALLVDLLAPS